MGNYIEYNLERLYRLYLQHQLCDANIDACKQETVEAIEATIKNMLNDSSLFNEDKLKEYSKHLIEETDTIKLL